MSEVAVLEANARKCPDCGTESSGAFCPNCGEMMEPRVLRIRHYFRDVLHELLALDSKFLRTIPALLFQPGLLPSEFVAGRRRRYLSPLRLHILLGILAFITLGHQMQTRFDSQMKDSKTNVALEQALAQAKQNAGSAKEAAEIPDAKDVPRYAESTRRYVTEVGPYVLLLCSTPSFALVLSLLYHKRKRLFVEHLMFAMQFVTFGTVLLIPWLFWHNKYTSWAVAIIFVVYLFYGLRRFYEDGGRALIFRTLGAFSSCFFIAGIAMALTFLSALALGAIMGDLPFSGFHGTINFNN